MTTTRSDTRTTARTAIVTGASRGLGLALTSALARQGWHVVADARDGQALHAAVHTALGADPHVTLVAGDVTDPAHRQALIDAAGGSIDLVVNNAGGLGPSPLPALDSVDPNELATLFAVNVVAPLALIQTAFPHLAPHATIVNITSDASVEPYEGWGVYGTTKAALDHLGAVLAAENPGVRVLTLDPGDMRTRMHQDAFPGEDISDRPLPEASVPGILTLIDSDTASGRYRIAQVDPVEVSHQEVA
ncbi:MAG TPA: SDR family NAD(P)-dependent oxidoreductase [Acidimicrobiia bacterium]|jgi:NAD(P)-dependent dehydrogenase (short-subunit alcohol dehydrogenase family)